MAIDFDPHPDFKSFAHPQRFVSAAWLSSRLGTPGLKVVESDEDLLLYNIGHIPGAVRIDWHSDLNDQVTRDFIDGQAFADLMREKGISREDTVVIYGDKSNRWAAYTLWVFELFGHPDVRLLDGGRDAWMGEERDTSFAVPDYPATNYPVVDRNDADLRVFVDDIRASLTADATQLIDVRAETDYAGDTVGEGYESIEGTPTTMRNGHIPGAVNIPWGDALHANARFRTREEIAAVYEGLDPAVPTVLYCLLGDQSAHTWFMLKYILGYDNVRNYDGSWAEWGNMVRMPIEQGMDPNSGK